ncbi:hypothetical protein GCWU000324_02218 [Kingella oralis ATCC 51147]|uniref:Uncharacterized protein n=1 Tax=Kingella oralis ATCC 51147 TaxID=629741 RepID=C4GJJ5_9NEIS|nr:hypothetical protein GCWU000324_02218 [Kingella oralis ATCC 51147]
MRRRTSARFFPKKGRSVRLDVGEKAVASTCCDRLGSLKSRFTQLAQHQAVLFFQAAYWR